MFQTLEKYSEAISAYNGGLSLSKAAEAGGVSQGALQRAMVREGIPRRNPGLPRKNYTEDFRVKDMIARREAGETLKGIGAVYGVSKQYVHQTINTAKSRIAA